MTASEFMAIAPMFASEDATRPSLHEPFRHGYAKDARRMAFVCGWLWNSRERRFTYCTPPYGWQSADTPVQHPQLGETPIERVAIRIGERVTLTEGGK